jgi:hypothetical protein
MGIMFKSHASGADVMDRALDADALFTPQVAPLTLPNGEVPLVAEGTHIGEPAFSTIYRETADGEQILLNAAVTPGYHAASYQQLFATADAMFPGTCVSLNLVGGGKKVVFTQELGDAFDIGGGDMLNNYLMYTGSLDSTWASACYGFAYRTFCTNQIPMGLLQMSQKRTVNHDVLLFKKAALLAEAANVFTEFTSNAMMLKGIDLTTARYRAIREILVPTPDEDAHGRTTALHDRRIAGIDYFYQEEVEKVGANGWALYNAVQSYEFHTVTKGNAEKQAEVIRQPEKKQALTEQVASLVLA